MPSRSRDEDAQEQQASSRRPRTSRSRSCRCRRRSGSRRSATRSRARVLIRDPMRMVAMAAIKSPAVTEFEAARYAGNQALSEDVIRYIAAKREWTKLYGMKYALCRNPKTPVSEAMRLLPFLREKDLTNLTKSKGVPSAVVAQARKLMTQRAGRREEVSRLVDAARPRARAAARRTRDRRRSPHAGRSGSDLLVAILVLLARDPAARAGRGGLARRRRRRRARPARARSTTLTDALVVDLGFLVVGAASSMRRCGAHARARPRVRSSRVSRRCRCLFVDLAASVVVYAGQLAVPRTIMWALSVLVVRVDRRAGRARVRRRAPRRRIAARRSRGRARGQGGARRRRARRHRSCRSCGSRGTSSACGR